MDNDKHYFSRAWALLTHDKGWHKSVLALCAAQLIPIVGPLGVRGYGLEWGRLVAWGVDAAPKQKGVDIGECIKSGFRGYVVALCYGMAAGLVLGILGMVPILSGLFIPLRSVLMLAVGVIVLAAELRATIYCKIGAGFAIEHLWEMAKRKPGGLLYILGVRVALMLPLVILLTIPWSIAFVSDAMKGNLFDYLELLSNDAASGDAVEQVTLFILNFLGHNIALMTVSMVLLTIAGVLVTLLSNVICGLWFRNFDVPRWGSSSDPLPREASAALAYPQLPPASMPQPNPRANAAQAMSNQQAWQAGTTQGPVANQPQQGQWVSSMQPSQGQRYQQAQANQQVQPNQQVRPQGQPPQYQMRPQSQPYQQEQPAQPQAQMQQSPSPAQPQMQSPQYSDQAPMQQSQYQAQQTQPQGQQAYPSQAQAPSPQPMQQAQPQGQQAQLQPQAQQWANQPQGSQQAQEQGQWVGPFEDAKPQQPEPKSEEAWSYESAQSEYDWVGPQQVQKPEETSDVPDDQQASQQLGVEELPQTQLEGSAGTPDAQQADQAQGVEESQASLSEDIQLEVLSQQPDFQDDFPPLIPQIEHSVPEELTESEGVMPEQVTVVPTYDLAQAVEELPTVSSDDVGEE